MTVVHLRDTLIRLAARLVYGSVTVGGAAAVISSDRKIVLVEKPGHRWALPGGFRVRGESAHETVEREVKEETGLAITVGSEICVSLLDDSFSHAHMLFTIHTSEHSHPLVRPVPKSLLQRLLQRADAGDPTWVPIEMLAGVRMSDTTRRQLMRLGLLEAGHDRRGNADDRQLSGR